MTAALGAYRKMNYTKKTRQVIRSNAPCSITRNGVLFSKQTILNQTPTEPITIWMETVEE